jgi:hypothetical protein
MWVAAIDVGGVVAGTAPVWLALGVLLHVANQVMRGRGWYALVRAAADDCPELRRRDAIAAWVAGAGAGGLLSARGGDAVRVVLLSRRLPRGQCPLLAGTLVSEGAGELATGAALVALALALGLGPAIGAPPPAIAALAAATILILAALAVRRRAAAAGGDDRVPAGDDDLVVAGGDDPVAAGADEPLVAGDDGGRRRFARLRRIAVGVGRGCAPLRHPVAYARAVLPWQLASRACRAGAIGCFLAAFELPVAPVAVLLVMLAQGGGRLLPFAPASVGAGVALLAASFEPVTGDAVAAAQVAAFYVGTSTVLTVVGAALSAAICLRAGVPAAQAVAGAGRIAGAGRVVIGFLRPATRAPAP